jgi:hypothetical protein
MSPKEIRKVILDKLYKERGEPVVTVAQLQKRFNPMLGDKELEQEIKYLEEKGYATIESPTLDKIYLSFWGAKITADGIDLCENPDLYGQIFPLSINNFGNVSNSNLAIGSPQANQTITQQEISPEIKQLLEELKQALANQDKNKAKSLFSKLLDFGGNIATQIITAAITYSSGLR